MLTVPCVQALFGYTGVGDCMCVCAGMFVCVCVCSFDVADLHIPWLRQQPFIFYSFCHLWPRQLLWHRRLSKQSLSHDMQHAAAGAAAAPTADAFPTARIKLAASLPKNSQNSAAALTAEAGSVIQQILLLVCYRRRLVEKTSVRVSAVVVHTLLVSWSFRLSMQLQHLSTTQCVSHWQVYLLKQTPASSPSAKLMFNSLHLATWAFNYSVFQVVIRKQSSARGDVHCGQHSLQPRKQLRVLVKTFHLQFGGKFKEKPT